MGLVQFGCVNLIKKMKLLDGNDDVRQELVV